MQLCNGVLAGVVGVTAACGVIEPWAAIVIGALAAALFVALDLLLLKLLIDDVVAAVPMHAGCGALGVLAVGFFATEEYVGEFYGVFPGSARRWGVFYGGDGRLLACQVVEVLVIIAWSGTIFATYFWAMRKAGVIRVPMEQELAGLDASKYGVITTNELPQMPRPKQYVM